MTNVLISRKEAADLLNASEKKIQRLTSAGKLTVIYQKRSAGGQEALYKAEDVAKLKEILDKGEIPPTIIQNAKTSTRSSALVSASKATALAPVTHTEPGRRKKISVTEAAAKLILNLAEASVLTHISEEDLRADLRTGKLRGAIRGRGWKIKRVDLEEYIRAM